uniref:Uncharacterized protein n=1 Tax=Tanacetum cinerariifolium TaxID=118510 RepID=A0A6L2NTA6_TANCI|nr:hypothetical protein [Tanacetum cinerariifolium]
MDLESAQNNDITKLTLLKHDKYEMWRLRIEQYFQVQDYALWDVIENGNSFKPVPRTTANADGTSTLTIPGPVTAEEKAQKKNDVKARSMLLMALLKEHLLTFSQYKDAKTLFEAIQARFGGNDDTKKTQRTLLKQMHENFNALSTESLDSIFNRLQKIVSQLAILGENISQEDLTMKFLRSLPSDTNEVDTASIQVSTVNTPVSTVSSHDNTTNLSDETVYAFLANQPNGSQLVHEDLEQIHEDDLEEMDLKWQLALLSIRVRRECKSPRNQESKPRNQDNSRKTVNVEDISSKAMVAIDGASFDWSYMADDEVLTNMALMAFSDSKLRTEFNKAEFDLATYKRGLFAPPTINLSNSGLEEFQHPEFKGYGPKDILTKSGIVPISTDRQSSSRAAAPVSAARLINIAASKPLAEAVNTACYVQNKVLVVKPYFKTPYELFKGRSPSLSFMRPFGCHVTILNTLDQLGKFDRKSDERIFVGYSTISKAFKVYNIRTRKVEENLHNTFLENKPMIVGGRLEWLFDIDALSKSMNYAPVLTCTNSNDFAGKGASFDAGQSSMEIELSQDFILMPLWKDNSPFDSSSQALDGHNKDKHGPSQASKSDNQERPNTESNTKTVNTTGPVNTATLTYADYPNDPLMPDLEDAGIFDDAYDDRDEGTEADYNNLEIVISIEPKKVTQALDDESWVEAIQKELLQLFLAYVSFMDFTVYQMDVKSTFLYGTIEEEVYVIQPPGFVDPEFLVYKLKDDILLVQVYADDIIFGSTKRYLKGQPTLGLWYPKDSPLELIAYFDGDYVGASLDIKSTTGGCQFLGSRLISWQCKKQTIVANSTTEEEYIAASNCCRQVLWLQT